MNRIKDLTKNTFVITLGKVSTQLVSFLLLPLYTSLLSTSEYGVVDLITTLVQLIIPVSSLMIDQGVFRYLLLDKSEEGKKTIITTSFVVLFLTSGFTILVYLFFYRFINIEYKIWVLLILIVTSFSNLFLQIARGLNHIGDYALGSFVCSIVTIILNILCIVSLHMGAIGMLIGTFLGNLVCCIFLFIKLKIKKYILLKLFSNNNAIDQLKYSIPLVPNQLSLWVMNSSDRLIITFFLGTAANGILAISHKFPAIYMTFFNIFQLAWHQTGVIHYFDEDRDAFFTDIIKKVLKIFSSICLSIIVVLPLVFNLFVNYSYNDAYYNIPIYMIAFLFNVVIGILGVVYVANKKTNELAKTTIIAAIINIGVNLALVNYIGLYAASISTFVGYLVTMIYRIFDTKKYLKIKYNIKDWLVVSSASVICIAIYYLNNKMISLLFIPLFIVFLILYNKDLCLYIFRYIKKTGDSIANKYKKLKIIFIVIILIISSGMGVIIVDKLWNRPQNIVEEYSQNVININPIRKIKFEDFHTSNFTCTGLAYDKYKNTFWIADYGALNKEETALPSLIEVNNEFSKKIKTINLSHSIGDNINLQGICYDSKNRTLWGALGSMIIEFNEQGMVLNKIDLEEYAKYKANGICYDDSDDTLWILCATKYILHYDKSGKLIKKLDFNYADQDHIVKSNDDLLITVGADYLGNDNFICRVSSETGRVKNLYRTEGSYSLEGIAIYNDKILIANDGAYHSDLENKSYISIYNIKDLK